MKKLQLQLKTAQGDDIVEKTFAQYESIFDRAYKMNLFPNLKNELLDDAFSFLRYPLRSKISSERNALPFDEQALDHKMQTYDLIVNKVKNKKKDEFKNAIHRSLLLNMAAASEDPSFSNNLKNFLSKRGSNVSFLKSQIYLLKNLVTDLQK
jgi:hypothetical protein